MLHTILTILFVVVVDIILSIVGFAYWDEPRSLQNKFTKFCQWIAIMNVFGFIAGLIGLVILMMLWPFIVGGSILYAGWHFLLKFW
jgi:hypothetical protein